jgi:SAM-dependent methyltransferase
MNRLFHWIGALPLIGPLGRRALRAWRGPADRQSFAGSAEYWEQRYAEGGHSGAGSYGKFARSKARVLNGLFSEAHIRSVIEFGCGDGNQLRLLEVADYTGVDVSAKAIERCRTSFAADPGKRFVFAADYAGDQADCALSLDVIYHLVEDTVFDAYMRQLFAAGRRMVVIYSSNVDTAADPDGAHVRHREFSHWVDAHAPQWTLAQKIDNEFPFNGDYKTSSFADFYVYVPRRATA